MQVHECLKSSKYLILALAALTASACASTQSSNRSFGSNVAQTADATSTNNESYDSRDATIEVSSANAQQSPMDKRLLVLVNKERATAGVKPLSFSPELAKAAVQHSHAMASEGFFEHRGEGEPKLFDRVTASGMNTDHVGENIFETSEGTSSAVADECVAMWMQSEGHRFNMLSPEFDKTGFSVKTSNNGENYITEDFAH
jgi:uncharacterized protein YkwD